MLNSSKAIGCDNLSSEIKIRHWQPDIMCDNDYTYHLSTVCWDHAYASCSNACEKRESC